MAAKLPARRMGLVLAFVIILSLMMSVTAYAQGGDAIVEVFRLSGTFVGIKITFPEEISGNFMGMLAGKGLDCTTIPSNVVYCIGPFQKGAGPSTLTLINLDTEETVLKKVVYPPKPQGFGEEEIVNIVELPIPPVEEPDPPECPPEECPYQ